MDSEMKKRASIAVWNDEQHGPGISVEIDGHKGSIYLVDKTGIFTDMDGGQAGVEIEGDWLNFLNAIKGWIGERE